MMRAGGSFADDQMRGTQAQRGALRADRERFADLLLRPRPRQLREAQQVGFQGRKKQAQPRAGGAEGDQLRVVVDGVLSGTVEPKRGAVAVQALSALTRAIEQERKIKELEELEERLNNLERKRGIA